MSIFWRFQYIFLVGVAVCAWATGAALPRTRPPCCYVCTLLRKADNGLYGAKTYRRWLMLLKRTVDWEIFAVKNVSIGAPK